MPAYPKFLERFRVGSYPPGPVDRQSKSRHPKRSDGFRPNEAVLERLATAILLEIDEEWIALDRAYITMDNRSA